MRRKLRLSVSKGVMQTVLLSTGSEVIWDWSYERWSRGVDLTQSPTPDKTDGTVGWRNRKSDQVGKQDELSRDVASGRQDVCAGESLGESERSACVHIQGTRGKLEQWVTVGWVNSWGIRIIIVGVTGVQDKDFEPEDATVWTRFINMIDSANSTRGELELLKILQDPQRQTLLQYMQSS